MQLHILTYFINLLAYAKQLRKVNRYICLFVLFTAFVACKKDTPTANKTNNITVINDGVSGNTAENLLSRINTVITQVPNLVIIMIGTNDAIDGTSTYNSYNATLSLIIDSLQRTGSSVMLLTPPPIQKWNTITTDTAALKGICTMIYSLSISKLCYYIDINTALNNIITTSNSHQLFLGDGIHPSAAGDKDIAVFIFNYIKAQNINAKKIVCFGDSITYGAYLTGSGTATGDTWPAVLSVDLNTFY